MVIALLTDFGTADHYVAAMKGAILSIAPAATIVDVTHDIQPQNIRAGAFILSQCFLDFPAATVFVAVVDPGVGSARKALAVGSGGFTFVAPDNGILSWVLEKGAFVAFEIANSRFMSAAVSSTFHGRDVFAPAAAHIINGTAIEEFGPKVSEPLLFDLITPLNNDDGTITGQVLHVDRFGNLITNFTIADIAGGIAKIGLGDLSVNHVFNNFEGGEAGQLFAYLGSGGFVEIALKNGSAQAKAGAVAGDTVILHLRP